jgi:hypothetical protein
MTESVSRSTGLMVVCRKYVLEKGGVQEDIGVHRRSLRGLVELV